MSALPSNLRITGTLAEDARAFTAPGGGAVVRVLLQQPGEKDLVRAVRQVGTGNAAQYAAQRSALLLRQGTTVTVHARWLRRKRGALELVHVSHIEPHNLPAPRHEPLARLED